MDSNKAYIPKIALAGAIILILVIAAIIFFTLKEKEEVPEPIVPENEEVEETPGFLTYQNQELDFEIKYPADWVVLDQLSDPALPRLNFYPASQEILEPVTHHSDVTQVSIFPEGIPTEGIFGENRPSDLEFSAPVRVAQDFFLDDGEVWATFMAFENMPSSWGESGFMFSRIQIQNLEESCFRGEEKLPDDQCDPLTGDQVVRTGEIDPEIRKIQEKMLESFRLTE